MCSKEYSALEVADYVVQTSTELNIPMSNLRLQKSLYFIQGLSLANRGKPAFVEEIEAWHYGPVVREVYKEFVAFGASAIPVSSLGTIIFESKPEGGFILKRIQRKTIDDDNLRKIIDLFLEQSRDYSDFELVELTHRQTPWKEKYSKERIELIKKDSIKDYFEKMREKANG